MGPRCVNRAGRPANSRCKTRSELQARPLRGVRTVPGVYFVVRCLTLVGPELCDHSATSRFALVGPRVHGARSVLNSGAGVRSASLLSGFVHARVAGPLRVASPVCVLPRRSSILWRVKDHGGARRLLGTGQTGPFGSPQQAEATVLLVFQPIPSQYPPVRANTLAAWRFWTA
jgi:hypothetical protein